MPMDWLSVHVRASAFLRSRRPYLSLLLKHKKHLMSAEIETVLETRKPYDAPLAALTVLKQELAVSEFESPYPRENPAAENAEKDKRDVAEKDFVSLAEAQNATSHPSQAIRIKALEVIDRGIRAQRLDVLASISLNSVAGIWGVDSSQRNYHSLRSKRNLSFGLPDAVVAALVAAVRLEGPALARRFYKLKRQLLEETEDIKTFTFADRLAPVSLTSPSRPYTWESAVSLVQEGFADYLPFCQAEFGRLLKEGRIDAAPSRGKRPGSFTRLASPETGPFVFLSFTGTAKDVRSLAREATHACLLSLRAPLGPVAWAPPTALAETVARLGERMLHERLRADRHAAAERLEQLMDELDGLINSILRQISFDRFEELVHETRKNGLLFLDQFDELWMQATEEMFGREGDIFDSFGPTCRSWATVLHFHSLPFGVYLFALAPLTAEILARRIEAHPREVQQRLFKVLASRPETQGVAALTAGGESGTAKNETKTKEKKSVFFMRSSSRWSEGADVSNEETEEGEESPMPAGIRSLWETEGAALESHGEGDPTYEFKALKEEPLLFTQLFESLKLNPQDVSLWATALKHRIGTLLTEAEHVASKLHRQLKDGKAGKNRGA